MLGMLVACVWIGQLPNITSFLLVLQRKLGARWMYIREIIRTDADGEGEDGQAGENILDQVGLAGADE
jgi:hypothetical protein